MQEPFGEPPHEPDAVNPFSVSSVTEPGTSVTSPPPEDGEDGPQRLMRPDRPRIWPSLVLPLISLATFLLSSLVMMVVAFFVVHGEFSPRMMVSAEAMKTVSSSRVGLLLLVVAPQVALVMPTLIAAWLSPVGFSRRLSLIRGHWPYWAWVAAALTTPLIGWISSIAVGSLMEESESLKMMSDIFRGHGESGFLIPLALLIGATPAFCEEFLFRGYVQTRLNRRIGPALGILLSSALFAVFHMDLIHIIAVFPLGLYLGVIAWRSGSLFPAMLGHFVNNSISVFAVVLGPETQDQDPTPEMALFLLVVIALGLFGAMLTAVAMWRLPVPQAVTLRAKPAV
ncbi:type II CAAX endopeptidase family protein [Stieleria mannarensis]|uniref:type II CAAX endopeptidase family protein n=1 Tax=Stieleria mannarensis TaxID=2755585 RepID=UPI001600CD37|nr:type II CAAX endopeptidase family protein [Rhodopirellula sp. JC639]